MQTLPVATARIREPSKFGSLRHEPATVHLDTSTRTVGHAAPSLPRPPSSAQPDLVESLSQAGMLGRYRLVAKLGDGGMGVVFSAYDPKLARNVAIKVMRSHGRASAQRRFIREAQAMARLSHPNVVQIYEIGEVGALTFIVMELVDGQTLSAWLRERPRPLQRVLEVFDAAGRGLAAAHDAGLVHRDFKPDNVMLRGDGRVLVMDFGLARREGSAEPNTADVARLGPLAIDLTSAGAVLGTPAYMAPEQFLGQATDARTDQFSFCVALWEAVHRQRPFVGGDYDTLSSSVITGRFHELTPESPAWLRRTLRRGLAVDPEQRWPTMTSLLAALRRGPRRRRRYGRIAAAVIGLATLAVGATLGLQTRARSVAVEACTSEGHGLDDEWNDGVRDELALAIGNLDDEATRASWQRLRATLDDYADEWARLREDSCTAADVDGALEPHARARVFECLDERRAAFSTLVEAWRERERWDTQTLAAATQAAAGLPDLRSCTSATWLTAAIEPPSDPTRHLLVRRQRLELERAKALALAGDHHQSLSRSEAVLAAATELDWRPLMAAARLQIGEAQDDLGRYNESVDSVRAAYLDATEAGDDYLALRAATVLAPLLATELSDHEAGLYWAEIGKRLIARGSLEGTLEEAQLLNGLGIVLSHAGETEAALAAHERALAIHVEVLGPDHYALGTGHNNMGSTYMRKGDPEAALEHYRRAQTIWAENLGPANSEHGLAWNNVATVQLRLGQNEEALASYQKCRAAWAISLGDEHPWIAKSIAGVGKAHEQRGELDLALAAYEDSLAMWERLVGPDDAGVAHPLMGIARVHGLRGEHELARTALERIVQVREDGSASPIQIAESQLLLAKTLDTLGERRRASKLASKAAAVFRDQARNDSLAEAEAIVAKH